MARYTYGIAIVERGKERLWRDFWDNPNGPSPKAEKANRDDSLGRKVTIEASNLEEAIRIAQEQNPDCTVIRDASSKIG